MKLYHGKGSCSLGMIVLMEELGLTYDIERVDLAERQQYEPAYAGRNPKSKVPLLELDDGSLLTEWPAIAVYLAASHPKGGLLPSDPLGMARALEAVDYVVSTVHMQGFTRIVRPGNFTPNADDFGAVMKRGREILDGGLLLLSGSLETQPYLLGTFSIADIALFYVEDWMVRRLEGVLPPSCQAHYERMLQRAGVQRAMAKA